MAQQVKTFVAKIDELGLIFKTHMEEGENGPPEADFWTPHGHTP